MFFLEPERTQFDLTWRMFGIHVRVHPMFWVFSAILGWPALREGFQFLLLWVLCVFVSILVHELGHIAAGRLFGAAGHIVLYTFGGLAIGSSDLRPRWQRVVVYFAGPLAGFLLLGVVLGGELVLQQEDLHPLADAALWDLSWINLWWGILNLMPVWPLDGGRISREVFEGVAPRQGTRWAFLLSFLVAALLAMNAVLRPDVPLLRMLGGGLYMAILFAMLALSSFQAYQAELARGREADPWDRYDDGRRGEEDWDRDDRDR